MVLGLVGVVLGFPACAPAVGVCSGMVVPSRLPVQVFGAPVRGDHIRSSAGVPRCLGVPRCESRMLPRQYAGIVADAGAGIVAAPAVDPAVDPAIPTMTTAAVVVAATTVAATAGIRATPSLGTVADPEMHRIVATTAGIISLVEQITY
jgi:hypothetical protein